MSGLFFSSHVHNLSAEIWACMLTASSQTWLIASWWEQPRCVITPGRRNVCVVVFVFNLAFGNPQDNPVTGRKADVIKAAHLCAEAALRLVKPGNQVKKALFISKNNHSESHLV